MNRIILSIFISLSCLISYCAEKKDPVFDCNTPEGLESFYKFAQQETERFQEEVQQMSFWEKIATFGFDSSNFYLNPLIWVVDSGLKRYGPLTHSPNQVQEQAKALVACFNKVKENEMAKKEVFVPQEDLDALKNVTHKFEDFKKDQNKQP